MQHSVNNFFLFAFRELLFTSRAEEFAVLREFSDALVRNLFPKTLWGQEVHRCALNEVVAIKGKKAFSSLCDIRAEPRDVFLQVWIVMRHRRA